MKEAGVLIDLDAEEPLLWHTPSARTMVSLPDSRELWEAFWQHRDKRLAFFHSHPGTGMPSPSAEDLTTFQAIECALGKTVVWGIVSCDTVMIVTAEGTAPRMYASRYEAVRIREPEEWNWLSRLRELSA